MSRKKLPRAQRQARHVAREQKRKRKGRHLSAVETYRAALDSFRDAVMSGLLCFIAADRGLDLMRVVCENCGLEQEYLNADNFPDDDLDVFPCPGPLDVGCGHEYCISAEHYGEFDAA